MRLPNPSYCAGGSRSVWSSRRSAVTLVEMLVALTLTLIIMGAVVTLFGDLGESVNDARAAIEMGDRLRAATTRLRNDLANATTTMVPPRRPEFGEGYLEYFEGVENDWLQRTDNNLTISKLELQGDPLQIIDPTWGDTDDLLALTIRSGGAPFVTSVNGTLVESNAAEVVWFVSKGGTPALPSWTLHRRQLLIAPIFDTAGTAAYGTFAEDCDLSGLNLRDQIIKLIAFRNKYDISHRVEGSQIVTNTLADLTKREARFMHGLWWGTDAAPWSRELASWPLATVEPWRPNVNVIEPSGSEPWISGEWNYARNSYRYLLNLASDPHLSRLGIVGTDRMGEDVVLTDLKGFDLQVFDAAAELRQAVSPDRVLGPGDPGFWQLTDNDKVRDPAGPVVHGAYVDLGFEVLLEGYYPAANHMANASIFSRYGQVPANALPQFMPAGFSTRLTRTYDTFSYHYEVDGVDNNDNDLIDEGSNGYNDNPMVNNFIDEAGEAETLPPYAAPLRGIQVRVRVYEPDSRQIRQVTVSQDYVRN